MKLHLTTAENNNLITAYSDSYIEINKQRYGQNLIVMPQTIVLDWHAENVSSLENKHFQRNNQIKARSGAARHGQNASVFAPKEPSNTYRAWNCT